MKLSRLIISVSKLSMAGTRIEDEPTVTVFRKAHNQVTFESEYPRRNGKPESLCTRIRARVQCSGGCLTKWVYYLFPILYWLPRYKIKSDFLPDLIAGLTVGVMHIPQGMAYSVLAGLDPVNGLYTSFFPPLIYMFLGSSRHISLGVFAVISLMVGSVRYKHIPEDGLTPDFVNFNVTDLLTLVDSLPIASTSPLDPINLTPINVVTALTFSVGVFLALMSVFRLGFVTSYLSDQVVQGFTTGAAFHVFTAQVDKVLNVKLPRHTGIGKLYKVWHDLVFLIPSANIYTVIMSLVCIVVLFFGKEVVNPRIKRVCSVPPPTELILVIITTAISYYFNFEFEYRMKVVGDIPTGLPMPTLPHIEYIPYLLGDALSISIVVFVVSVSMAKLFAKKHHYKINANQELQALGVMQMGASLFGCWTSCVSLSRSLVFESAGAATQLATLFSCSLLLVVLMWLGPLFQALPTCVLACIIMVALKGMFMQLLQLKKLWPVCKIDFGIWLVAFSSTVLLDITYGLGISVVCALISVVYRTRNPHSLLLGKCDDSDLLADVGLTKVHHLPEMRVFKFNAPLLFLNADRFRDQLIAACEINLDIAPKKAEAQPLKTISNGNNGVVVDHSEEFDDKESSPAFVWGCKGNILPKIIAVDCSAISAIDVMGLNAIKELHKELREFNVRLVLASCCADVLSMFTRSDLYLVVPKSDVFPTVDDAVAVCSTEVAHTSYNSNANTDVTFINIPQADVEMEGVDVVTMA